MNLLRRRARLAAGRLALADRRADAQWDGPRKGLQPLENARRDLHEDLGHLVAEPHLQGVQAAERRRAVLLEGREDFRHLGRVGPLLLQDRDGRLTFAAGRSAVVVAARDARE